MRDWRATFLSRIFVARVLWLVYSSSCPLTTLGISLHVSSVIFQSSERGEQRMTIKTGNWQFIDSVIGQIIQPGTDRLMESRYFSDLRAGKLTTRLIQGFALQHYIHNMGMLKAFALGATQHVADNRASQRMRRPWARS